MSPKAGAAGGGGAELLPLGPQRLQPRRHRRTATAGMTAAKRRGLLVLLSGLALAAAAAAAAREQPLLDSDAAAAADPEPHDAPPVAPVTTDADSESQEILQLRGAQDVPESPVTNGSDSSNEMLGGTDLPDIDDAWFTSTSAPQNPTEVDEGFHLDIVQNTGVLQSQEDETNTPALNAETFDSSFESVDPGDNVTPDPNSNERDQLDTSVQSQSSQPPLSVTESAHINSQYPSNIVASINSDSETAPSSENERREESNSHLTVSRNDVTTGQEGDTHCSNVDEVSCNGTRDTHQTETEGSGINEEERTSSDIFLGDAPAPDNAEGEFGENWENSELGEEFRKIMSSYGTNWLLDPNAVVDETSAKLVQQDEARYETENPRQAAAGRKNAPSGNVEGNTTPPTETVEFVEEEMEGYIRDRKPAPQWRTRGYSPAPSMTPSPAFARGNPPGHPMPAQRNATAAAPSASRTGLNSELWRLGYRFGQQPDSEEAAEAEAKLAAAGEGVLSDSAAAAAPDDDPPGPAPQGASLAFVFDSTGSMHDDLQQVMVGTQAIMQTMLEDEHKPIHNYVLVPFHDPKVGPLTVTTNHTLFNNSLKAITVHAGGDCPEMALGGIKVALEASLPRSFIYVFTDASAKDTDLLQDVVSLVQRKKSQVVFVLTGDCGDRSNLRYRVYEKIADTSSGQVFHLNKTEVEEVLKFVKLSLQSRRVNLLSVTKPAGSREEHSLLVDRSLDEFTVAVAGENAEVGVEDPHGQPVALPRLQPVLSLKDVKVVKVENPDPGQWKVRTASDSTHSVRSTGTSRMDITFGFSVAPVANIHQTFYRPLKGTKNHILIQATEHRDLYNLTSVRLVNMSGSEIINFTLSPVDPDDLSGAYTGNPFVPPTDIFFIEVTGIGSDGFPLKRMTPTAISAQKPDVPIITMKPRLAIPVGQTGTITCYVESLIPFNVVWLKDGGLARELTKYKQTTDVFLQISNMSEAHEGSYTCHAMNEAGSISKQTKLRMTGPPPVVSTKERIVTNPGEKIEMICEVESVLNYTVSWSRYSGKKRDLKKGNPWPIKTDSHTTVEKNKLIINMVKPDDEGWYSCLVQSRGGKKEGNTYLQVRDPVRVVLYPPTMSFQQGEEISISCRASGTPIPKLEWRKSGNVLEDGDEDGRISITSELGEAEIVVKDADQADEGHYECFADNGIDTDHQESVAEYVEVPSVTASYSKHLAALGETVVFQCEKNGVPTPILKWYKDSEEILLGNDKEVIGDILTISNVKDEDAGTYTCEASNTVGTSEDNIELDVGTFPHIIQPPADVAVDINQNISLPCVAIGHPLPTISWQRKYQEPLPDRRYQISTSGTLHIFNVHVEDAGIYICRVENNFGGTEKEAKIKVTGIEKPMVDRSDVHGRVVEKSQGTILELPCRILMGNPVPERTWFKDGMEIDQQVMLEDGFILDINGSLIVPYMTYKHEGTYECVVRNVGGSVSKETIVRVVESPRFSNKVSPEQHALVGEDVQLHCDVQGEPKPLVTWEKDGLLLIPTRRIIKEDDDSLTIRVAGLSDKGIYTCIATNSAGTSRRSMFLSMQSPPKISSGPSELHAVEGQLLTIKCEVTAEPSAQFSWWRNGKPLNSSIQDIQYLHQNSSIRFVATVHAQGKYTCVATNPAGKASKDIQVSVMVPPNIYPPYEEQIAAALGENFTLDCQVYGSPPPKVYWQKDGVDLNDENLDVRIGEDGTLTILNISNESGGVYICDAENDVGISQKLFYFSVNVPPKILEASATKVQLMEGEDFYLPCTASGYPFPDIHWHKDGRDIIALDSDDLTVHNDGTLMLHSVNQEHSGLYVCVAENKHGSDHRNYIVNVLVPPSMIQAEESELEVKEGDSLVIACPAMDAVPPPQIEWLKDGRQIDIHSRKLFLMDNGRALKIIEAHPSDRGTYWCVASNLAGQSSVSFNVDVLTAPSFSDNENIKHLENHSYEVIVGKPITLRCAVNGHPAPRVTWKKNNHPITVHTSPGVVLSGDKQILHIPNTHQHDAGHYQCSVANKVGSSNRDFKITVLKPPSLVGSKHKNLTVVSGSNVLLHCPFTGLPEPSISWAKDYMESNIMEMNNAIISSDQKILEISAIKPADTGIYVCDANNKAGHEQRIYHISVLEPPSIVEQSTLKEVSASEGDSVSLRCWIQGTPHPQVMWMHNGHVLPHLHVEENETLNIKELKLNNVQTSQAGQYTCLASNEAGVAEKSFHLHVMVAPKMMQQHEKSTNEIGNIIDMPEHLEKIKGMPIILHCPVEGKPLPEVHWVKDTTESSVIGTGPTLQINNSQRHHSGNYTCIAHNEAGIATKTFEVLVQEPPLINGSEPNLKIKAGDKLTLHCAVSGFPSPEIMWFKGASSITPDRWSHATFLNNNSTLIVPDIQVKNAGQYSCLAMNKVGTAEHNFNVEVFYAPHIPESIPVNTTHKVKMNRRLVLKCPFEGFPMPHITWYKNGIILHNIVDSSIHISSDHRQLHILHARTEDAGIYKCRAENSAGNQELLFEIDVQTMAQWTNWGSWSECTSSCGPGEQVRTRTCGEPELEDPFAQIECPGLAEEWQSCDLAECQVNGGWSEWSSWTSCSTSCGRGTRRRYRDCSNPMPMYGGKICIGSDAQQEYCRQTPCPINGQWSDWTPWSDCSVTCNNGVQHRTRQCNNPPPSYGGANCSGKALEVVHCNSQECPQDGQWKNWSKWSPCSTSCGPGNKQRTRECIPPKYGGNDCKGENLQISHCSARSCDNIPNVAELRVKGTLNGEDLADSLIAANITEDGHKRVVQASINDILKHQAGWFPYLTFMLSPISWNTAIEKDEANNGYSLTQGRFKQDSVVEFASGEGLMLRHIGRGINDHGILEVEIEVNGQVPIIEKTAHVVINSFEENYVQTSPNSLFASSASSLNVNGVKLPYSWNNTVSYDSLQGTMPYLVEKLQAEEIGVKYNPKNQEMTSAMSTAIGRKYNQNTCPDGFVLDTQNMHCRDINECSDKRSNRCHVTQICENLFGTYRCSCERGFRSSAIGKRCVDINECLQSPPICSHRCRNTRGSFKCQCPPGYILLDDGRTCSEAQYWDYSDENEDTNFVRPIPRSGKGRRWRPSKLLPWTVADEQYSCPSGYEVLNGVCHDVDECKNPNICSHNETCLNMKGSFRCLETPCPEHYQRNSETGYCQKFCDENPCEDGALLSQTITYMVVVPEEEVVHRYQDLVQLSVRGDNGHPLAHTRYRITENETGKPFRVRFENGQGVLYSLKSLPSGRIHRVVVLALSYDESETNILYTTKFIIFIHLPDG